MKFIESVASYVPGLIVDRILQNLEKNESQTIPWRQKYETVCLFCDVSGFTALSEAMAMNGMGAEGLAKHLNSYFGQMLRLIASDGGDVFKFAGDAMIVLWPETADDIETTARRAAQCACAVQDQLNNSMMDVGVQLSVKIGVGIGSVSVLHVGGVFGRVEYLAVGDPLIQAFRAEHHSSSGQVICSKEVWAIIKDYFTAEETFADSYVRLNTQNKKLVRKTAKISMLRTNMSDTDPVLEKLIKSYVPGAVVPILNRECPEDEQWGNELRRCTVVFVNLGLKEQHLLAAAVYDEAMFQVNAVLEEVQQAVYQYEGSINKFLMDDKGSTLIACFGLPPVSHEDDPIRAILASILLCERLHNLGLVASAGITTGDVFCGVVGGKTRREYSVLGDSVNLSARLMQKASESGGGVMCDWETKNAARGLAFIALDEMRVKGKSMLIKVFRPYLGGDANISNSMTVSTTGIKVASNTYHLLHKQQLQNISTHILLTSLQSYFYPLTGPIRRRSLTSAINSDGSYEFPSPEESKKSRVKARPLQRFLADESTTNLILPSKNGGSISTISISGGVGGVSTTTTISERNSIKLSGREKIVEMIQQKKRGSLYSTVGAFFRVLSPDSLVPIPSGRRGSLNDIFLTASSRVVASQIEPCGRAVSIAEIQVLVYVPREMRLEYFNEHSTVLPALTFDDDANFQTLLNLAVSTAIRNKQVPITSNLEYFALNVTGTRTFLPVSEVSLKWLPAFISEAKQEVLGSIVPNVVELVLTRYEEKHLAQSRLAHARKKVLELKAWLLDSNLPSITILEGEAGAGKSEFLSSFLSRMKGSDLPEYYTSGSAYADNQAFGVYSLLIQQFLDYEVAIMKKENGRDVVDPLAAFTRTDVVRKFLKDDEVLLEDAVLLDELLGTTFLTDQDEDDDEDDYSAVVPTLHPKMTADQVEISARRLRLMFVLLHEMAARKPIVIVIDNAHFVDDESWALSYLLALSLSTRHEALLKELELPERFLLHAPPIMMILSLRPLAASRSIYRRKSTIFESLSSLPDVINLKLDGLPPEEVMDLIATKLECEPHMVSDDIFQLIDMKCRGNPWKVIEQLHSLLKCNPPVFIYQDLKNQEDILTSDSKLPSSPHSTSSSSNNNNIEKRVGLVPDFFFDKCPVPLPLANYYGFLIDRLPGGQQLILKVAAKIGYQFKQSFLLACLPIGSHRTRLTQELSNLEAVGLIIKVANTIKAADDKDEMYHFTSAFVSDIVKSRMLKEQQDYINQRVLKHKNNVEAVHRRKFMEKTSALGDLIAGQLEMQKPKAYSSFLALGFSRKSPGGDWKSHYCNIKNNELYVYRDKAQSTHASHSALQSIILQDALCEIEASDTHAGKPYVFRLEASWRKDGSDYIRRNFLFAASSAKELSDWVYMIQFCIESWQKSRGGSMSITNSTRILSTTGTDIIRNLAPDTESAIEVDEYDDNNNNNTATSINGEATLLVTIFSARNLLGAEVYGPTNCYVKCVVGEETRRTSCISVTTSTDGWRRNFKIPLTSKQWAAESLHLSLWNKDLFLSDDFLGERVVALDSLPLLPSPTSIIGQNRHDIHTSTEEWLSLHPKGSSSSNCNNCSNNNNINTQSANRSGGKIATASLGEIKVSLSVIAGMELTRMLADVSGDQTALKNIVLSQSSKRSSCRRSVAFNQVDSNSSRPLLLTVKDITELFHQLQVISSTSSKIVSLVNSKRASSKRLTILSGRGLTGSVGKALAQRVNSLMTLLDEDVAVTKPTVESGSINRMWIRRELRQLLEIILVDVGNAKGKDAYGELRQIMARASELDPQHLDWLSYQYSTGESGPMSPLASLHIGRPNRSDSEPLGFKRYLSDISQELTDIQPPSPLIKGELVQSLLSTGNVRKDSALAFQSTVGWSQFGVGVGAMQSVEGYPEPPVIDPTMSSDYGYYYLDAVGVSRGPFEASTMWSWLSNDLLHVQVMVRHGPSSKGMYFPLGMFVGVLHRTVDHKVGYRWPSGPGDLVIKKMFSSPDVAVEFLSWDFDVLKLKPEELMPFTMLIMSRLRLPQQFNISSETWICFVNKIEKYMTAYDNPYHNMYHVVDVMHGIFLFIHVMFASFWIRDIDILAVAVAALVHDLDHPGTNNVYQINAQTPLAILYNDISVLENHHCATAFELLRNPNCDIFSAIDITRRREIRNTIISCVLSTDMVTHFSLLSDITKVAIMRSTPTTTTTIESTLSASSSGRAKGNKGNHRSSTSSISLAAVLPDNEREIFLKALVHAADISNPAKPFIICKKWSDLVVQEFFAQGDREKEEGLPVSPNMDRNVTVQDELSLNFIDFIVAPFFFALGPLLPDMAVAFNQIKKNRDQWDMLLHQRYQVEHPKEEKYNELIGRWDKKKNDFENVVNPVISAAEFALLQRISIS